MRPGRAASVSSLASSEAPSARQQTAVLDGVQQRLAWMGKYLRRGCIIRRIRNGINFGYSKHAVSKRDDTRIFRGNNRQVNYLHGTVDTQYSEIDNKQTAISGHLKFTKIPKRHLHYPPICLPSI